MPFTIEHGRMVLCHRQQPPSVAPFNATVDPGNRPLLIKERIASPQSGIALFGLSLPIFLSSTLQSGSLVTVCPEDTHGSSA